MDCCIFCTSQRAPQVNAIFSENPSQDTQFLITDFISVLGIGLFRLLVYIVAPVSIAKTGITLLHMYLASVNLGKIDVEERRKEAAKVK